MNGVLRDFHRPGPWLLAWVVLIKLTFVLCLVPLPSLPGAPTWIDKAEHGFGYAVLSAYAAMLFEGRRALAIAALGLVGVGLVIEALQALVPWRSADPVDALANALGVALGMVVAATPAARWLERLDRRLR